MILKIALNTFNTLENTLPYYYAVIFIAEYNISSIKF